MLLSVVYESLDRCLAGFAGYFLNQSRHEITGQCSTQAGFKYPCMFNIDLEVCGALYPVELM